MCICVHMCVFMCIMSQSEFSGFEGIRKEENIEL